MNPNRHDENYIYFRERCKAHGIDPDAQIELRPNDECPALELEEDEEACAEFSREREPPSYRQPVKETKQQMAGYFTAKQERRKFRR